MPSSRPGPGATLCGEKGAGIGRYRLRDHPKGSATPEIKRMTRVALQGANDVMTAEGQAVDKAASKRWWAEAAAEDAEAFREGRF